MTNEDSILHKCLYFTANLLSRLITRMAEEEFRSTGLSPSHAFLMMLVNDDPGITQKELATQLHLAPSTVTRLIESMDARGYLERLTEGRSSMVYATDKGEALRQPIAEAWHNLHMRYANILGLKEGDALTAMIDAASEKLSKER